MTPAALAQMPHDADSADGFTWPNATVYFVITDRFCNGDTTNPNALTQPLSTAATSRVCSRKPARDTSPTSVSTWCG